MMKHTLYLLFGLWLLTACSTDDAEPPQTGGRTVMLHLSLAADNALEVTRAPGDPGEGETLTAPMLAYFYFVDQNDDVVALKDEDEAVLTNPIALGTPTKVEYHGSLSTLNDEVYRYLAMPLKLPPETTDGEFYVVVSPVALWATAPTPSNKDEVLALMFDATAGDIRNNIQNIYSTPYNYEIGTPGHYYGRLSGVVDLMLYHVAARVDVKWNVDESIQTTNKVSTLAVTGLKSEDCHVFKPMANTALGDNSYGKTLKLATDVGSQWYGRTYFYAIPYTVSDQFNIPLLVNGNSTTVKLDMSTANPVFAPWIRLNLKYDEASDFSQSELPLSPQ